MVFSGFQFARAAAQRGMPAAVVSRRRTRADGVADVEIEHACTGVVDAALAELTAQA